jgi:hypothetical protein
LRSAWGKGVFDDEVSAFHQTNVAQSLLKVVDERCGWWADAQKAKARYLCPFLRARRE